MSAQRETCKIQKTVLWLPDQIKIKQIIFSVAEDNRPLKEKLYATLPKSLKEQNLITATLIEDPEVVAKNQEIVKSKTPAQLAQINNLDEFPIPNNIETLIKNRTLKSTSSKEASLNKR